MTSEVRRRFSWERLGLAARFALFSALTYVFVLRWVDPRIIHDRFIPVSQGFSRTAANLAAMLHAFGGAVAYAAGYLHQYYCYGWLGSLLITAVAVLVCVAVDRLLPVRPGSWLRLASFVPALLLLVPYCLYEDPLPMALGVLTALVAANLYVRMAPRGVVPRAVLVRVMVVLALTAAVFYLAGLMCLVLVGVCLCVEVRQWVPRRATPRRRPPPAAGQDRRRALKAAVRYAVQVVVLLAALVGTAYALFDQPRKETFQRDYFRHNGMWREFLEDARRVSLKTFAALELDEKLCLNHDINRALYHEGRLLDEMFCFPQDAGALFLIAHDSAASPEKSERIADLLFELGRVNAAECDAHEMLQRFDDLPSTLRLLAEINIVKEQTPAARAFLGYLDDLRNDPRYERWAERMLRRFETEGALPVDERLRRIQRWNAPVDSLGAEGGTLAGDLQRLVEGSPDNRMAFEYLMALYLLTNNLEGIAGSASRLRDLGYERIPRHLQEALLLYSARVGKEVDLHGYQVAPATRRRLIALLLTAKDFEKAGRSREQFLAYVAKEHGNTYFWHYFFSAGPTPAGAATQ